MEQKCKIFSGRFNTFQQCMRTCGCKLSPDMGSCQLSLTNWYYNEGTRNCETFTYKGCEGNGNRQTRVSFICPSIYQHYANCFYVPQCNNNPIFNQHQIKGKTTEGARFHGVIKTSTVESHLSGPLLLILKYCLLKCIRLFFKCNFLLRPMPQLQVPSIAQYLTFSKILIWGLNL